MGRRVVVSVDKIIELYTSGKSIATVAANLNVSRKVVKNRLVKSGVNIRSAGKQLSLDNIKTYNSCDKLSSLIDGLLLGDAWLEVNKNGDSGRLGIEQREDRLGWLTDIKQEFSKFGIKSSIRLRSPRSKNNYIGSYVVNRKDSYVLKTHSYKGFGEERDRWYTDGIKKIPIDIDISSDMIVQWYCGDGSCSDYEIKLYTNNFKEEDVNRLINILNDKYNLDMRLYHNRGKPIVGIGSYPGRTTFYNLISDDVPNCFRYKLNFKINGVENE